LARSSDGSPTLSVVDLLASSPPMFIGVAAALGLLVGSFLNVVI
jgi:hypothetical protein